ncbi:M20 metallopeptidase family protein [Desulfoferrobacter suflitae]|uniref:M20 metallopeptidase family protein n=1 Tax=Desulfoferrobacter suflitae TaxID=2865782 RepID=UPI0021643D64|nr:M20 family metallopeptidase [Desulfoferrobacter suflitae]MCK8601264.1 M20 family metallopeptidase [Desulfoferrobacter suflitae]
MIDCLSEAFHDWLVELRRHFHQYPEAAYQERRTAARIAQVLDSLHVGYTKDIAGTGIVASMTAKQSGPTLALRGDMDALPLVEANEVPYKSKNPGLMHACGHDGHITMLLGTLRWLLESGWPETGRGKIIFLFQPAEESGAGAKAMLESGILDAQEISAIFAAHMHPELPTGTVGLTYGVGNAASTGVRIRLTGRGGHGAHPHLCADPIVAGAYLVAQLQSIISRNVSPLQSAVLSVGCFQAGTAANIIPQEALLEGTLRTLNDAVYRVVETRLKAMVSGMQSSHGVAGELTLTPGYPLLINDDRLVAYCIEQARKSLGESAVKIESARMGAEDFAYFLQKYPGVLIRLGCHDPQLGYQYGLHSPRFDFDERALDVGVRLFARFLTGWSA